MNLKTIFEIPNLVLIAVGKLVWDLSINENALKELIEKEEVKKR